MNIMISPKYANGTTAIILKRALLVFIVVLFFCDIAIYLSLAVSDRLEPQYWIALLVVLGGTLAWVSPETRWQVFSTPLFLWCVLFSALTLIFFITVHTSHIEQFKEQIRTVVLLATLLGVFLMLRDDLNFLRKLVMLAVLVGVLINLVSLFHSGFFPLASAKWAYRPTGFYSQPNESGIALTLGMLLSAGMLSQRWRTPFVVFVLAGVAVTFSREAVLGWIVAVICLCVFKIIKFKLVAVYAGALIVCAVVVTIAVKKADFMNPGVLYAYHFNFRRFYGVFLGVRDDVSAIDRWTVLKLGWTLFLAHPFMGNGIGSTYHWALPYSTHNMYLLYMDDYGIIGIFLYPLLIWCMIYKATGEPRRLVWTMAIFLLFWGFFDHNVVQNYYSIFAISMTAATSRISDDESRARAAAAPVEAGLG